MTDKMKMYEDLRNYYLDMRESLIDKMKKEDDERSNLKFKIAALAIYELTHSMPEWLKDYFLASMAGIFYNHTESADHLAQIESQFHGAVADYLLKMEKEVNYAKKAIDGLISASEKKAFWKPIVLDAFLITGIYFTPSPISWFKKPGPLNVPRASKPETAPALSQHQVLHDDRPGLADGLSIAT